MKIKWRLWNVVTELPSLKLKTFLLSRLKTWKLYRIVKNIGDEIGQKLTLKLIKFIVKSQNKDIVILHQMKARQFNRENKINHRPKLNTTHLNLTNYRNPHLPIFINASMTGKTKKLH